MGHMDSTEIIHISRLRLLVKSGTASTIRLAAGVSMREAADAAGVSVSSIWRWEHGERVPHGQAALRYARLLNDLLEGGAG